LNLKPFKFTTPTLHGDPNPSTPLSPATMRMANPSAMAVLPTPGSPMRTGLFLGANVGNANPRINSVDVTRVVTLK
jgi:hypothetical protein